MVLLARKIESFKDSRKFTKSLVAHFNPAFLSRHRIKRAAQLLFLQEHREVIVKLLAGKPKLEGLDYQFSLGLAQEAQDLELETLLRSCFTNNRSALRHYEQLLSNANMTTIASITLGLGLGEHLSHGERAQVLDTIGDKKWLNLLLTSHTASRGNIFLAVFNQLSENERLDLVDKLSDSDCIGLLHVILDDPSLHGHLRLFDDRKTLVASILMQYVASDEHKLVQLEHHFPSDCFHRMYLLTDHSNLEDYLKLLPTTLLMGTVFSLNFNGYDALIGAMMRAIDFERGTSKGQVFVDD